jgi:hypothetical protein
MCHLAASLRQEVGMALRNISIVSVGAVAAAVALGWGFSILGTPDPSVEIQEVADPAWQVEIEEVASAEQAASPAAIDASESN